MMRKRVFSLAMIVALLVAVGGIFFSGYVMLEGDPFLGIDEMDEDDGVKHPDGDKDTVKDDGEDVPAWIYSAVAVSLISAMAFLMISGSLYMRSKRGDNMVRNDLLDLITVNPGINLSTIRKELQLSQGAVSYHIMKLEKMEKIFSEKGSKERRYYPSSMGYRAAMEQAHLDEIRSILSNETSQRIVEMLKSSPLSQNDLVQELDISPSTVHWHMERMKKVGMISKESHGRSVIYELKDLPDLNT